MNKEVFNKFIAVFNTNEVDMNEVKIFYNIFMEVYKTYKPQTFEAFEKSFIDFIVYNNIHDMKRFYNIVKEGSEKNENI